MKHFQFFLLALISLFLVVLTIAFVNAKEELPNKHLEVVLRNIGHQLLLKSGDSTSRILPVKKINELVYQISFENSFDFTPDTLMNLIYRQLAKTNMPKDYIVSVNDCNKNKTVFAFEINKVNGDLKPCSGRVQEKGCYLIQIDFLPGKHFNYAWLLCAFIPMAFVGFYHKRKLNKNENQNLKEREDSSLEKLKPLFHKSEEDLPEFRQLGRFRFFEKNGFLSLNNIKIELTEKETKALIMFAFAENMVVNRERLRKEIWEDEGVFVINRNVDVLVSKLRKKLSDDPSIKIVNVHGKGYKLMIS